jgi:hypothetical protein
MRRRLEFGLHACAAALLAGAAPAAQGQQCDSLGGRALDVAGQVVDARALAPLRAAVLLTAGRDTLARLDADSAGFFSVTLCRREGIVAHFRRIGYRADSIAVAADTTRWTPLDVAMSPLRDQAVTLAETRVTAPRTLPAVESRARRAGGLFVGEEEIDRLQPARVSDLLRARRGIALEDAGGELRVISSRGFRPNITRGGAPTRPPPVTTAPRADSTVTSEEPTHKAAGGGESCALRVGVNGHLMPEEYRVDEMPASDVVAIEIYAGAASMPVEFSSTRRSMNCGLVMIWTRAGVVTP